jgi:hypothetical protein
MRLSLLRATVAIALFAAVPAALGCEAPAKPELFLKVPKGQVVYQSESGTGQVADQIIFANGKTTYAVALQSSFTRLGKAGSVSGDFATLGMTPPNES